MSDRDTIERAIRHIDSCLDVDPWARDIAIDAMKAQLSEEGTTFDLISRQKVRHKLTALINELEEIFAHIRERHEDDSVCGLCEYDGAYIEQSGDWCNECPGFDRADCFKLKEKYRKEWLTIDE